VKRYVVWPTALHLENEGGIPVHTDAVRLVTEADHLADRASMLSVLRQAVEAMDNVADRGYMYTFTGRISRECKLLRSALAAARAVLEEKV
jgi:hypothetical protein